MNNISEINKHLILSVPIELVARHLHLIFFFTFWFYFWTTAGKRLSLILALYSGVTLGASEGANVVPSLKSISGNMEDKCIHCTLYSGSKTLLTMVQVNVISLDLSLALSLLQRQRWERARHRVGEKLGKIVTETVQR